MSRKRRDILKSIGTISVGTLATGTVAAKQSTDEEPDQSGEDASVTAEMDDVSTAATMPAGTWWGVYNGRTTASFDEYIPGYDFGCNGAPYHAGVDVGAPTGNWIYAWGPGRVVGRGYDNGGYNRWIQVYFPSTNQSLTLGHLLDGTELPVGTWFERGDKWAEIGTNADGLGASHVHFRADWGNHGYYPISPCEDINPFVVWDDLGNPS